MNEKYSLNILLPNKRNKLLILEEKLTGYNILDFDDLLYSEYCAVALPKFNKTQHIVLNGLLQEVCYCV